MIETVVSSIGAAARALKPRVGPPSKISKGTRKVGKLRAKAVSAAVAGKTNKAERFTKKANARANKENVKSTKEPGYIGIPYGKHGAM